MTKPPLWLSRHGYLLLASGLVAVFLALFALAEWLHVPVLPTHDHCPTTPPGS